MRRLRLASLLVACATGVAFASCGGDFDPASLVNSVRVLAVRADKPYAKPGDSVELEMLAFDGRKDKTRPMAISWIPVPCINPQNDTYYFCFSQFASRTRDGDAGVPDAA